MSSRNLTPYDYAFSRVLSYSCLLWRGFMIGRHHRMIARALEKVERGEILRLIVTMPPRHGKSKLITEDFVSWFMGRNPEKQVMCGTYGQRLADKWGRRIRNQMATSSFRSTFPGVRLADDSRAMAQFDTNHGGSYFGTGRGGSGTGMGAHLFVVDDPTKDRKEAESRLIQQNIRDWYTDVVTTRLMPGGAVIIIMTRWTDADLVGYVTKEHKHEGWTVLNLPAIAEENDPMGRAVGEALWPEQYSLKELQGKKATLPPRSWAALYQQRPVPQEGLIVKPEFFLTTRYKAPPLRFFRIIVSLDTARKAEESSDPNVWTVWGEAEKGFYLLDVVRARMEYTRLKSTTISLAERYEADLVLIEDSANGNALEQDLRATTRLPLLLVGTMGMDKASRLSMCTDVMEGGRVWLPEAAPWLPEYEEELFRFPGSLNDDQVDSTSQALNHLKKGIYLPLSEDSYQSVPKDHGLSDDEEW